MGMSDFLHAFPKLAETEVRDITVGPGNSLGLPAGRYGFIESYCDEKGCDCRRVLIGVLSEKARKFIAHINLGFDSDDAMAGPFLDPLDPQGPQAEALLDFFTDMINNDPAYLARLHRHYVQFKEQVEGRRYSGPPFEEPGRVQRVAATRPPMRSFAGRSDMAFPTSPVRREVKIGRNDPCPCGSGKKYKQCCLGKPLAEQDIASVASRRSTAAESDPPKHRSPDEEDLTNQVEQLVSIVAARRQLPGNQERWSAKVQETLETVHAMAFPLLHLLLDRYAPDGRQQTPPPDYAACLSLLEESLTQIRFSVERKRSAAIALSEQIQKEIADLGFRSEVDIRVQQDLIMALHEAKLPLHPSVRDKAAEVADYYARFSAGKGEPSLDTLLERLILETQPADACDLLEPTLAQMALMPPDGSVALAAGLMASAHPLLIELAVLMLLHPEPDVRRQLPDVYRDPTCLNRINPLGLRRLIGLRNWLPAAERPGIDALIEDARRAGMNSASLSPTKPIGAYASAVDGAGTQALWLAVKDGKRYRLESVLLKQREGIREAFSRSDLKKRELDANVSHLTKNGIAIAVDSDYLHRSIKHAIAAGGDTGKVPPPQLLVANEWAGGGYWKPEAISAADEIERLRASEPDSFTPEREQRALLNAGNWPRAFGFGGSWFEDDACVEDLLREHIGKPERWTQRLPQAASTILSRMLEEKRDIWTERLVLMALWSAAARTRPPVLWQDFLINAIQLQQATPLTEIPLMRAIAERTVETAWQRFVTRG